MTSKHVFVFALLTFVVVGFLAFRNPTTTRQAPKPVAELPADLRNISASDVDRLINVSTPANTTSRELLASISEKLRQRLERPSVRPREAVLTFKDTEALRAFLARADNAGLEVLDRIDAFNTVRVRYQTAAHLARELIENAASYSQVAANFLLTPPVSATPPEAQARAARSQTPVGNQLLSTIGVTGDNSGWGNGVTIAILDSGVAADPTFGLGRLHTIDVGLGTAPAGGKEGGHGTAVASLAAGQSTDAQGVAPAASLLSIRVVDDTGKSDAFTVARGILAAADAGAKIINVSLGGYGSNFALDYAIEYATTKGAVIVAAAGNDQAAQLSWPAADTRVVSVGATDATGQQVIFSNSGEQLQITAPGLAVQAAWSDGSRVSFSGTSGSAPVVSGAIATILSQNPELTATQAWQILQTHASEAGRPGTDADYGNGVLNLGWSVARNNPTRIDTAIASHYYSATNEQLQIVLQNRSATAVSGLDLTIEINGALQRYPVSWLAAGTTTIVNLPISTSQIAAAGQIDFRTELVNPSGLTDALPANNRRTSALRAPGSSR